MSSNRLTEILLDYMDGNKISRVFSLLTRNHFIDLIKWEYLHRNFKGEIYGYETDAHGWPILSVLGKFFNGYVCADRHDQAMKNEVSVNGYKFRFRRIEEIYCF